MIKVRQLSKTIRRRKILDHIDAELKGITGIIGPNGAGKTTFLNILAGLVKGDRGSSIMYEKENVKIGFLPQHFELFPDLSVEDVLSLLASLKNVKEDSHILSLMETLNLTTYRTYKMKDLSGGTKRRVGIAQALLERPHYLIIDEPTIGLDIGECMNFRNMLLNIKNETNIILSSHIPEDISFLCDHVLVIHSGQKVFEGSLQELIDHSVHSTYDGIVDPSIIPMLNQKGHVIPYEIGSDGKVRIRYITNVQDVQHNLKRGEPDFLSGYLSLFGGAIL